MLLTFVGSLTVLFVPGLRDWQRFVPLFCGISLPLSIAAMTILGQELPAWTFGTHTASGWALLGLVVLLNAPTRKTESRAPAAVELA